MPGAALGKLAPMPKKSAPKKSARVAAAGEEVDPRFVPVAAAFAKTPGVTLMESKSKGMRGLMLNGKSFGMSHHGRFMLKLTEERAEALIAEGVGDVFEPSAGRALTGWIEITRPGADWVALAKEAHRLGVAEQGKGGKTATRAAAPKRGAAKKAPAKKAKAAKKAAPAKKAKAAKKAAPAKKAKAAKKSKR